MYRYRLLIITISLLVCSRAWGADTLASFGGFEEQSTLSAHATSGSPAFQTTSPVRTGTSSLELDASATQALIRYYPVFDSGGAGSENTLSGGYYLAGFAFRATDVTPSSQHSLFIFKDTTSNGYSIKLALDTSGNLLVVGASTGLDSGTTLKTITTPFSINTWYYIELGWFQNDSGNGQVWIDGSSQGTFTGDTLQSNSGLGDIIFYGPGSGDGNYFYDDYYILYDSANAAIPTPLAASSDGLEVFAYQCGKASQAADAGYTALDSTTDANNWDTSCDKPWSATAGATYTGTPLNGAVVFNDAATNGHGLGPTGGAYTIDGTIKGGKWSWLLDRGTGGGTTHSGYYGSSGDTPLTSFTFTDPDADVLRAKVLDASNALVPTSSESFAMGVGVVGAQDFEVDQMMGEILHLPPAAATTGSALIWLSWVPQEERVWQEKFLNSNDSEVITLRMN